MLVADKESGMIFFPDNQGNPDFSQGFYVKKENKLGLEYILRVWNYFWEKGEVITE
jgi:hypothetical protein